ncbi:hypothetical protein ES703_24843 [subsurface metagenome]
MFGLDHDERLFTVPCQYLGKRSHNPLPENGVPGGPEMRRLQSVSITTAPKAVTVRIVPIMMLRSKRKPNPAPFLFLT